MKCILGSVAEPGTHNPLVLGSSPARPTQPHVLRRVMADFRLRLMLDTSLMRE